MSVSSSVAVYNDTTLQADIVLRQLHIVCLAQRTEPRVPEACERPTIVAFGIAARYLALPPSPQLSSQLGARTTRD
jgi:hypothetical protein